MTKLAAACEQSAANPPPAVIARSAATRQSSATPSSRGSAADPEAVIARSKAPRQSSASPSSQDAQADAAIQQLPILQVDPRYFRPTEVETLLGDPAKAKTKLGWTPKISFDELVAEMVREDLKSAERDELIKKHGYKAMDYHE